MKSHVQLPKSVLKNFSFQTNKDGKCCYVYDFKSKKITIEKIKELGTIKDFYSESTEKYLSKMVEQPFGMLMKKFKELEKGNIAEFSLDVQEQKNIKSYANYLLYRSDNFIEQVNQNIFISKVIGDMKREYIFEKENEISEMKVFDKFTVEFLVNRTDYNFILPRNGYYYYLKDEVWRVTIPITPKLAFMLIDNNSSGSSVLFRNNITEKESIKILNRFATRVEESTNFDFLASYSKQELIDVSTSSV